MFREHKSARQSTRLPTVQQTWHGILQRINAISNNAYRIADCGWCNHVAVEHKNNCCTNGWEIVTYTTNISYYHDEKHRKSLLIKHFYQNYGDYHQ